MAQTLKLKRSAVSGNAPSTGDLALGEIAINTYDGKIFIKKDDGTQSIVTFEAGGSSNAGTIEEDSFTGNGNTTGFTLTTAPSSEENLLVFIDATFQNRDSFTISGTTITFDTAPDTGSSVRVYHVIPGTLDDGILTVAKFAASAIVTEAEGISSNDNDTTIPTSAAVKDYVDTQVATVDTLPEVLANGNTTGGTDISVSSGDNITFADSSKAIFGAGSDLEIFHDGTNSVLNNTTGNLQIYNNADDGDIQFISDNGSGGTAEYFRVDGGNSNVLFSKNLKLSDSLSLQIGDGNDFQLSHNGTDTFMANNTGIFYITQNTDDANFLLRADNGSGGVANYVVLKGSTGEVLLNHYGNNRFKTTADGVNVMNGGLYFAGTQVITSARNLVNVGTISSGAITSSGLVTADGLTVEGDATIKGGSDVSNTGATLQLESTETQAVGSGASISFKGDDGSGTQRVFSVIKGSKTSATSGNFNGGLDFFTRVTAEANARKRLAIASNGDISFYEDTGTTAQMTWDASADALTFTDNTKAIFGAGSDLQIYHDGSTSYILDDGTGDLQLRTNNRIVLAKSPFEYMADFNADGAVDLYYDNSKKLATTSTGIDVTGTTVTDGLTSSAVIKPETDGAIDLGVTGTNKFRDLFLQGKIDLQSGSGSNNAIFFFNNSVKNGWLGIPAWDNTALRIYAPSPTTGNTNEPAASYKDGAWSFWTDYNNTSGNGSTSTAVFISTGGSLNVLRGDIQVGSTTVISSARNLENIGTISSGNITTSGFVQSNNSTAFTANGSSVILKAIAPAVESGHTTKHEITYGWSGANDRTYQAPKIDGTANFNDEFGYDFANENWYFEDLLSIGSISSGAITSTGTSSFGSATFTGNLTVDDKLTIGDSTANSNSFIEFGERIAATETNRPFIGQTNSGNGVSQDLGLGANSSSGTVKIYAGNVTKFSESAVRLKVASDHINFTEPLQMGGTQFLSDTLALSNISSISSGNITTTGYLRGPSTFTIDPATHGDDTGTVVIAGNLQVDGTTTTVNSTTVQVSDKTIELGYDATTDAANNNAGIIVHRPETSNSQFLWNETNERFEINRRLNISQLFEIDASGANDTAIKIGSGTSSNHYAYIDLIGDSTYNAYGLRIIRNNGGANTSSFIYHRGTGNFNIETQDSASLKLRTAGADALTIDSSQNATFAGNVSVSNGALKVGTVNSISGSMDIYGGSAGVEGGEIRLHTTNGYDTTYEWYRIDTYQDDLRIGRAGNTDITLDSSGRLLVGKTAVDNTTVGFRFDGASGFASFVRDGGEPLLLNRKTSDGSLILLRKDGANVGVISTESGRLNIGTGDAGIAFIENQDRVIPRLTSGGNADASIDLGDSASRFRNLHLSGTISSGAITATSIDGGSTVEANSMFINTPDGGGAPATTAILSIHGYEGRGAGIKIRDSANSASGASNREWFIGSGYSQSGFNIGYSSTGSQSSYSAQNKLSIDTSGNAIFAGTISSGSITSTGNLLVNGITAINKTAVNSAVALTVNSDASTTSSYGLEVCNATSNTRLLVDGVGNTSFYGSNNAITARFTSDNLFQIGGQTVIDSSRNLTNIGTISSTGNVTHNITATQEVMVKVTNDSGQRNALTLNHEYDRDIGIHFHTTGGDYEVWIDSAGDDSLILSPGTVGDPALELYQNKNAQFYGNIIVAGTVDGRDLAADGTKLDTIDTNADVTPSWVPSSDPGYITGLSFNGLSDKTLGTGTYSTSGFFQAGRGSGGVALTHNDGYGNANVTFNHVNGIPEQGNNCGRIVVNTDSTTGAKMTFELLSNSGTAAVNTPSAMELTESGMYIPNYLYHLGDTDTYLKFDANRIQLYAGGNVKFDSNNTYLTSTGNTTGTAGGLSGTPNITVGTISSGAITTSGALTLSLDTADVLNFSANSTLNDRGISFNNRSAVTADSSDGWLRLNQNSEFSNGVYTPANFRSDGNVRGASYSVVGTVVIDNSRNLTNIGTISSGAIDSSGTSNFDSIRLTDSSVMGFGTAKAGATVGHTASVDEGIFWHTGSDYGIYRTAGAWSGANYQQLKLRWATGIEIDGNGTTYGKSGINFLNGNIKMDGTQILDVSRNLTNIATISSGNITLTNNSHLQLYTTAGASGTGGIDLPRGGHITFYGNNNVDHSIGSRSSSGAITDDLRISSYGALYIDLDANANNSSGADFVIGRHGSGTGTMSNLFSVSGETGAVISNNNITAYGSPSDIRLKENIETIEDSVEKVKKLRGVTFNYKKDGSKSTGLIAQELEEVLPEVVYETHDLHDKEDKFKAVRYGNIVGLLVEAIKDQQKQIEELKEEVLSLRSKN